MKLPTHNDHLITVLLKENEFKFCCSVIDDGVVRIYMDDDRVVPAAEFDAKLKVAVRYFWCNQLKLWWFPDAIVNVITDIPPVLARALVRDERPWFGAHWTYHVVDRAKDRHELMIRLGLVRFECTRPCRDLLDYTLEWQAWCMANVVDK
jgi:hypothetical protein